MTSDGERFPAFQVARQVLTELSNADLFQFPYCVPCVHNGIFLRRLELRLQTAAYSI
jgi:hypothetical protein